MPINYEPEELIFSVINDTFIKYGELAYHSSSNLNGPISSSALLAPNIYIDSTEINSNHITVNFHLENDNSNWLADDNILNNVNVYVLANDTGSIESLYSLKNRSNIVNSSLYSSVKIYNVGRNIELSAFCGNNLLRGKETYEIVMQENFIATSSYENINLKYITKNKDLRLLEVTNLVSDTTQSQTVYEPKLMTDQLFISYNTDKVANIGFVFDIEKFFHDNSSLYRTLSRDEYFKEKIFANSTVKPENIKFYKKNITTSGEYKQINTVAKVYRTDVTNMSSSFIITISDDKSVYDDRNKYAVKVKIDVDDYSYITFKDSIISPLVNSKKIIDDYRNNLMGILGNNSIDNKPKFFFNNYYLTRVNVIKEVIQNLSLIYSFYSNIYSREQYISLFSSLLHPYTTRIDLLDVLLSSINDIQAVLSPLVTVISDISLQNDIQYSEYKAVYEKEFKQISLENQEIYYDINYNFDAYYGYEVMSVDSFENRKNEVKSGFKVYTIPEKNLRSNLEMQKYFSNNFSEIQDLLFYSVSKIDIKDFGYDLMLFASLVNNSVFNEIYSKINAYNNNENNTKIPDYYFYNLLKNNVYVKTLGTTPNVSYNNYFRSIISDPNEDSYQTSLQFMLDTGIEQLNYIVNKEPYIEVPDQIHQSRAILSSSQSDNISNFPLTEEIRNDPLSRSKMIMMYNMFYRDVLLFQGNSFSLYSLEDGLVHPVFSKKLKLYNKYYILENIDFNNEAEKNINVNKQKILNYVNVPDLEKELKFNVESKYLNRNTIESKINITTSDI